MVIPHGRVYVQTWEQRFGTVLFACPEACGFVQFETSSRIVGQREGENI